MRYSWGFKIAGVCFSLLATGCATIISGSGVDQSVRLSSQPRGAAVTVDGRYVGLTPISTSLTRKDSHKVHIELAGYKSYDRELNSGFNPWFLCRFGL